MSESKNNDACASVPLNLNRSDPPKFYEMNWEAFEELTRALLGQEPDLRLAEPFRIHGQKQYGVDSLAQLKSGDGIAVASSKCYEQVTVTQLADWSDDFLDHLEKFWAPKNVHRFVLAVGSSVNERGLAEAVEKEKARFAAKGIDYQVWAPHQLQDLLRPHRGIVSQYLGPDWVPRLCGEPERSYSNANVVNVSVHLWVYALADPLQLARALESVREPVARLAQAPEEFNLLHRSQLPLQEATFSTWHTWTEAAACDTSLAPGADEDERAPVLQTRLSQDETPDRTVNSVHGKLEHWLFISLLENWYLKNGTLKKSRWKLTSSMSLAYAMLVDPTDGKAHVEFFLNEDKLDLRSFLHRAWSGHKAHSAMLTGVPDRLVVFTHPRDWYLVWDDEEELGDARDVTELLANRGLFERSSGNPDSPAAKSLLETLLRLFACEQANLDETEDPFEFSEEAESDDEQGGWGDAHFSEHEGEPVECEDDEQESLWDAMCEQNPGFFHGPWDDTRLAELGAAVSRLFSGSYHTGEFAPTSEILPRNVLVARRLTDSWLLLSGNRRQPPTVDWSDTEFKPYFFRPARKSGVCV
ncbi:hypothetical protein E9536_40740 [Burkholderia sp. LS-044]|uniref:hypothetical protein n=1 Tax=Burkholderia sp. LS-044 TaxID=1459967 RepID=UPI0010A6361F|nr:hypothetical protein [Burkholderia sp. LS-044]THJ45672.1 hypothetical protein E9536_40740 [Burkholderia sp. LS-044]